MAPSPARITTTQGPSRNSFEATLRSSDPPKKSANRRDKSPGKSPARPLNRDEYRPGAWRTARPESQSSNASSKISAARSTPIESISSSSTKTSPVPPSSHEAKYEAKYWEKCGERESSWPKMTSESIVSAEAPITSATASSLSSSMTGNRSQHRSPSRESEKKVRINLEPMGQQSSYSRSYHTETKSSSSTSKHDDVSSPSTGEINTVTTTSSSSKEVIECSVEVPEDGWSLKDAIKKKLLNPRSGMFNLPTSRQIVITFREALKCKIINPISADVVDPARLSPAPSGSSTPSPINTRPISLYRALEKGLLDDHGGYTVDATRSKITLEEAIDRGFVTYDDRVKTSDSLVTQVIKIVRTEGLSPKDEVTLESSSIGSRSSPLRSSIRQNRSVSPTTRASSSASTNSSTTESKRYQSSSSTSKTRTSSSPTRHQVPLSTDSAKTDSSMTKYEEFVEIGTNIFYCPSSDTVFDEVTGKRTTLADSLALRQIDWAKFSVIDTLTGKPIGLSEAISRKILDPVKYFVFDAKRGKTYSLSEAVKRGLFILTASPLLLMESASAASHVTLNPGPYEGDENRSGSGRLVRETVQVLKSREIFIKDPSTGQEVPLEEAVRKGLVDRETADRLKAQEAASSGFSVKRSVDLTVHDPRTGQEIPLELAVRKGIIDNATADRIRRGEVIENVISTNVTLVDDEQENWADIVSEINERLDLITEFKAFQQNYTAAKKWLDGIDRRLRSLAADYDDENDLINIESKRSKVALLKHELTSQAHILSTVDRAAESCKARMDRGSIEFTRIERLTQSLHDQYKSCLTTANDLTKRLNDLDQARSKYYSKLTTIDQELETISRELDKLISSSTLTVSEKEIKLSTLETRLTSHRSAIGECEAICDHLCRLLTSTSEQSKARNGLNEIERKYRELQNDLKELTVNYKDFQSFTTRANEFTKWQSTIETSLSSKSSIINSQQLNYLQNEFERIEEIIKTIQSREVDYEDLIESGNDLICRFESHAPESNTIRSKLATINATWESIRSSADKQISSLESCLRESTRAKETLRKFNSFLDCVETDYSNLPEVTDNQLSNEKLLSFVEKLKSTLDSHHSEYLTVSKLRVTGIDSSINLIEKEVKESCSRYEKINQSTIKKSEQLREIVTKLSSLGSTIKQIASDVDKFESKIHSSKVMTSTTFDSRLTETTKSLINQSHNLMDKIDSSKVKVNETGFTSFINEINHYSERVKSLSSQLTSRLESLQSASSIVDKIQRKFDKVENQLKQEDISINRLSASISTDSVITLEKQKQEIKTISMESEQLTNNLSELSRIITQEEGATLGREWETTHRHFVHLIRSMESRHTTNLATLDKRQAAIESALNDARSFEKKLSEFESWLSETESTLEKMEEASYLTETLETQMSENQRLEESIRSKCRLLDDLEKRGTSSKQREILVAIRHRVNRLTSRCTERSQTLDRNLKLAREFVDKWTSLIDWLTETEVALESRSVSSAKSLSSRLVETRNNYKNLLRFFEAKKSSYEATMRLGSTLRDKSPKGDSPVFQRMLNELSSKWESTLSTISETLSSLETDLNCSEKYSSLVKELSSWLQSNQISTDGLHGDVSTVTRLIKEHSAWYKSFSSREEQLVTIKRLGEKLISNNVASEESSSVKREINELSRKMSELREKSILKEKKLKESLRKAEQLETDVNRLVNWLTGIESSVQKMDLWSLSEEKELTKYNETIESYMNDIEKEEVNRDRLIAECQNILLDCHPDAEYAIRHYISIIESKWESVNNLLKTKSAKCKSAYNQFKEKMNCLDQLLQWISRAEQELEDMESTPIPDETSEIQRIIEQFESFRSKVMKKETEFDQVATDYYNGNSGQSQQTQQHRSSSRSSNRTFLRVRSLEVSLSMLTHPKAIELIGRWQKLVKALNDRLIRLRSKHNYFSELERLRDFDFDAWRRRFLDWMNEKKAKIMDFFRKMDDDHDGKVNYEQFIEGFIKSKFPTSRSEMSKVATIFDRNSDGYIDSKEWMDTLRDKTEAEIIKDEVFRQVAQCTCRDKYKVFQVEERKYRFGESQKLRLVRILRSVVMVRVGGGWVSLNEFLIKNDPCRAKGRTNVELREPLADGVSQSMAAFQPKVTSTPTEGNVIYGPITKIREKTEKSMPMSTSFDDNSQEDSDDLGGLRSRSRSQPRTGASSRASDGLSEDVSLDGLNSQQSIQHQRMSRIDNKPRWR